jgi:hypothetical protein
VKYEAAAKGGFFVAATDIVEHLLAREGVDGRRGRPQTKNTCKEGALGTAIG